MPLDLPGAAEARLFVQEGFPGNQLTLSPHQKARASLSEGREGECCCRQKRGESLRPLEAGWGPYRRLEQTSRAR